LGEDKNVLPQPRNEQQFFVNLAHSPVTILTELPSLKLCYTVQLDVWKALITLTHRLVFWEKLPELANILNIGLTHGI